MAVCCVGFCVVVYDDCVAAVFVLLFFVAAEMAAADVAAAVAVVAVLAVVDVVAVVVVVVVLFLKECCGVNKCAGGFLAFVSGIGIGNGFGVVVKSIPHSNRTSIFCTSRGSASAGRASKC